MQLSALSVNSSAVNSERLSSSAVPRLGNARDAAPLAAGSARADSPLRGGLRRLDLGLNGQAAALQQTLGFVHQAQTSLVRLKAGLSESVAEQQTPGEQTQDQLRQFAAQWQLRAQATAGSLDGNLRLVETGQAQQKFSIRGLDEPQGGEEERLLFTVQGRASTPVVLAPELSPSAVAKRLDQALAPLGVRVAASGQGALQFSAAETEWPAVRDSLMVKGEGRRFPTGQFNRVRTSAEAELVRPESWQVDDPLAARQTLRDVVSTGSRLQAVMHQAGEALNGLAQATDAGVDTQAASRAMDFAQGFRAQAQTASFAMLASVLPASIGLGRERVTALLSLAVPG